MSHDPTVTDREHLLKQGNQSATKSKVHHAMTVGLILSGTHSAASLARSLMEALDVACDS